MANAEFSRQEQNKSAGFGAGSYRETNAAPAARTLTPLQQKLAGLEKALPAPLRTQAAAAALCVVLALVSVFGLGGAKLSARYREAANAFTAGVAADNGYTMWDELNARANNAANVITSAGNAAGVRAEYLTAAQTALDAYEAALAAGDVSGLYDANEALTAAVDQLYADLQANSATPTSMGAVQTQYSQFNSAGNVLRNLSYNDTARQYNAEAGGFPASLIGALWGVQEVELFA